ncbi:MULTISPECIES: putative metalloprotease CJM1_0395 family protein [Thermodesulfovibrio]|uniref:putative metalloprotease CJM1_0395 family protein n=1 Tax=Thermodesulfovibrio TaxID=28261 RepID=UPI00262F1BB8|nr:putative metalloprotease CJM1_0395 family protein [Thermodesulfovibrio sp.]
MKIQNNTINVQINSLEQQKINQIIQKLRQIENRVIAHENAHKAVAGKYAGAVSYTYTKGPDGKMYVTGGEVPLDTSEESTPEETIAKMEIIQAAALAPSDPSPQDVRVAQIAALKKIKAQIELSQRETSPQSKIDLIV